MCTSQWACLPVCLSCLLLHALGIVLVHEHAVLCSAMAAPSDVLCCKGAVLCCAVAGETTLLCCSKFAVLFSFRQCFALLCCGSADCCAVLWQSDYNWDYVACCLSRAPCCVPVQGCKEATRLYCKAAGGMPCVLPKPFRDGAALQCRSVRAVVACACILHMWLA